MSKNIIPKNDQKPKYVDILPQNDQEQKQEHQKKKTVKEMLEGHRIYCYPANGKIGYPGWNDPNLEKFLRAGNEILKKYPSSNLAVNLELSNLICIDIDDPEKFTQIYDVSKFNTALCKTPRGYHIFLRNNIGLDKNINIKDYGVEILCKNHLANIYGEGYQLTFREIKNASEYKDFFDIILNISNSKFQNKNSLSEYGVTQKYQEKRYQEKKSLSGILVYLNTPNEIFELLERLEKDFEFIRYALNLFVGVEAKRSMLCVLHDEKHESAGFYKNKSGIWCYKDFHDGKVYSVLDLLLAVFEIPDDKKRLFKLAFAYYLVRAYLFKQNEKEIKIVKLLRDKSEKLARVYLLIASLNSSPGKHFLSVRDLAEILGLRNITKANRLLNYLCLVGVFEKLKQGYGKAYGYRVRKDINIEELEKELERTKKIDIYRLSREKALEYFNKEKVEKIYLRVSKKKELVGAVV
jgi:hypothetical protein